MVQRQLVSTRHACTGVHARRGNIIWFVGVSPVGDDTGREIVLVRGSTCRASAGVWEKSACSSRGSASPVETVNDTEYTISSCAFEIGADCPHILGYSKVLPLTTARLQISVPASCTHAELRQMCPAIVLGPFERHEQNITILFTKIVKEYISHTDWPDSTVPLHTKQNINRTHYGRTAHTSVKFFTTKRRYIAEGKITTPSRVWSCSPNGVCGHIVEASAFTAGFSVYSWQPTPQITTHPSQPQT